MKKLLAAALVSAVVLSGGVSVFADNAPATELVLAEGSRLVLDRDNGIIDKIDGTVTVGELKESFVGEVSVEGKTDEALVATDDTVTAGEDSLRAVIWGDVDRDGKVNLSDVAGVLKAIAGWETDISSEAGDVDRDGSAGLEDAAKLLKHVADWDDVSLGNVRMVFENKALTAENESSALQLSFTSIMHKVGTHELSHTGESAYKMKLGRNESESCMVVLWSDEDMEGMTAELTPLVHEYGDAVLESELKWTINHPNLAVFTTVIRDGKLTNPQETYTDDFPEVVLSMADSFELVGGENHQLLVNVTSVKETPAGMYKGQIIIKDALGNEVKKADVYAEVYDFTVPDTPYSASLFGTARNGFTPEEYREYYDHMLDHNLSSYVPPVDLNTEEGSAFMDDPRVTAFIIDGFNHAYTGDIPENEAIAAYNKIKANPTWFDKGLFYYTDEPYAEGLFLVKERYEYLVNLLGVTELSEIRNLTPFGQSYPDAEHQAKCIDAVEFIKPYINVWVPISSAYHRWDEGGRWTPRFVYNKYGEYVDRVEEMRERGDDIWWYICIAPEVPYPNYFTCYQGVINRLVMWQQYFNDIDGLLYYATGEYWGGISKYQFNIRNGDGTIQFPGEFWGRTGPCESWRLYQIRDGFDDFDYLRMAEEIVGREEVMKIVSRVSSGMLRYTEDYRVLEACRDELMDILSEGE